MAHTAGSIPGMAIPPPKINNFRDWNAVAANDMFPDRDYTAIMSQFSDDPTVQDTGHYSTSPRASKPTSVFTSVFLRIRTTRRDALCAYTACVNIPGKCYKPPRGMDKSFPSFNMWWQGLFSRSLSPVQCSIPRAAPRTRRFTELPPQWTKPWQPNLMTSCYQ
jgi:hypothetical protein